MHRRVILLGFLGLAINGFFFSNLDANNLVSSYQEQFKFPDTRDEPPSDYSGLVFRLSQDYPSTLPPVATYPWKRHNYKTQWKEYMKSVLQYCFEGNIEIDFVVERNALRRWYHAPWLHWGRNGREFIHGLTHERVSEPEELARTQTSRFQNWAVGFYNAPGGYVIGQVWKDPMRPNAEAAKFPEGTVSFKLLFTQATPEEQVPYLRGAPEWQAYIYRDTVTPTNPLLPRTKQTVRLLQIDIAVRDTRAENTTGWVFGTFIYNAAVGGTDPWKRMVPIGLMWGNDPGVTVAMVRTGHQLKESIINTSTEVPFQHLGYAGRLNGPVDNPTSSCLSCHGTAQWPISEPFVNPVGIVPRRSFAVDSPEWLQWFRNLKAEESFTSVTKDPRMRSLGYSLQLLVGIQNFYEWQAITRQHGGSVTVAPTPSPSTANANVTHAQPSNTNRRKEAQKPVSREGIPEPR